MICNSYNTNISTALEVALNEVCSSADPDAVKSIVLISDGGTEHSGDTLSYDREIAERAKEENVRIYTVAVGKDADTVFAHQAYHNYIDVTPSVRIKEEEILGSEAYLKRLNERARQSYLGTAIGGYTSLCAAKVYLMMDDYYTYCEHSNPDGISDEMWDAYCTEFNKAIRGSGVVIDRDIHYFRNELNRAPATRDELMAEKEKWTLLSIGDSLYHMYGEDGLFNTKFLSNEGEGKYEGVYDKEGVLLAEENDPVNMGTYNYGCPTKDKILHGLMDVVPYGLFGNVKGYPAKRIPRSVIDFYADQEAQDAYNKIKEEMEND